MGWIFVFGAQALANVYMAIFCYSSYRASHSLAELLLTVGFTMIAIFAALLTAVAYRLER